MGQAKNNYRALCKMKNPNDFAKSLGSQIFDIVSLSDGLLSTPFNEYQFLERAMQWLYCHPNQPWETETELLFIQAFQSALHLRITSGKAELLKVWTRNGTTLPCLEGQKIIEKFADSFDCTAVARVIQQSSGVLQWFEPSRRSRLCKAISAFHIFSKGPLASATITYFFGDSSRLSEGQKHRVHVSFLGINEDYPVNFAHTSSVALLHPEPFTLASELLKLAYIIGARTNPAAGLVQQSIEHVHYLDQWLDTLDWSNDKDWTFKKSEALVASFMIQMAGNPLNLDVDAWQARAPRAWQYLQQSWQFLGSMGILPLGDVRSSISAYVSCIHPLLHEQLLIFNEQPAQPLLVPFDLG